MNENTQNLTYNIEGNIYNVTRVFNNETDIKEIIKKIILTKLNNNDIKGNNFTETKDYAIIKCE